MSPLFPHLQQRLNSALSTSALIELAYEAAAGLNLWPRWFAELATRLGDRASNIVIRGFGPTRYVSLSQPDAGFATINPAEVFETKALATRSFAIGYIGDEIVEEPPRVRPKGSTLTSVEFFSDASHSLQAPDRRMLRELLPHLHRALTLHFRLDTARREHEGLEACLDEFSTGMMLVDHLAVVLHANRAAVTLLTGRCGIVQNDGKLKVLDRDADVTFRENLKRATSGNERSLSGLNLGSGITLWLRGLGQHRAVVYVAAFQQQRSLDPGLLTDAFGLTPAEARVGSLFAMGHDVGEIADRRSLSVHTVRLHLKKIQRKTGTHRQATLLRRMLETLPNVTP